MIGTEAEYLKKWCMLYTSYGLHQVITNAKQVTSTISTLIDHILVWDK